MSALAALINIFILTVDQMTMCEVKGVASNDKPIVSSLKRGPTLLHNVF